MLVPNNNPNVYKEHIIQFFFEFGEDITIIYWIEKIELYVSNIEESYKYTIIGNMGNSGIADLLLHIVQC